MRLAWVGRTSTYDQQDPTLSLPRQLTNATSALPPGWVIVTHFYDIESGRLDLEARGHSLAHEQFDIPIARDGGLDDLLAEAQRPNRRFDAVICESVDRISRRTYYGTKIEHELAQAGVVLFAADEPIVAAGKRSTSVLTRRVKQAIGEWYVLHMLEDSWDGFIQHTQQGWNIGVPPYGYLGHKVPHPVPAKREQGRTKTRLVPDPDRAPVVAQIYLWRTAERLAYKTIADRLNEDLESYPPPVPVRPGAGRGCWTASSVRDVLTNPKYTGHMVWNRRASKQGGKVNPPSEWVWSAAPTHPAVISRELFDAAAGIAAEHAGSRDGAGPNHAHPQARRAYLFRSLLYCKLCGRRMFGKTRRGHAYYACQLPAIPPRTPTHDPQHPKSLWVSEAALLDGVSAFFATRVFGADRRALLAGALEGVQTTADQHHQRRRQALTRALADNQRRQARLVTSLEEDDTPAGTRQIRARLAELEAELQAKTAELAALSHQQPSRQPQATELLDALPVSDVRLAEADPAVLRGLFEAFRLEIVFDKPAKLARCRVTLYEDSLPTLVSRVEELTDTATGRRRGAGRRRSHAPSAPGGAPGSPSTLGPPRGGRHDP